jgi:three-Cys-motif partner protein
MNDLHSSESHSIPDLPHLKRVSRIKHTILEKYFPSWALILASQHSQLSYFDCFAGPGAYEFEGKLAAGSPVIAVKAGIEFLDRRKGQCLRVYLIEDDAKQVERLEMGLKALQPYTMNLTVEVKLADSRRYVPDLLESSGISGLRSF